MGATGRGNGSSGFRGGRRGGGRGGRFAYMGVDTDWGQVDQDATAEAEGPYSEGDPMLQGAPQDLTAPESNPENE